MIIPKYVILNIHVEESYAVNVLVLVAIPVTHVKDKLEDHGITVAIDLEDQVPIKHSTTYQTNTSLPSKVIRKAPGKQSYWSIDQKWSYAEPFDNIFQDMHSLIKLEPIQ